MSHPDDASAMAFAVLRNRGYRFLAVSTEGVVVSNGSPTLAIDVSRPVRVDSNGAGVKQPAKKRTYHRRSTKFGYILAGTNYREVMLKMEHGETHEFSLLPGVSIKNMALSLGNAAHRLLGKSAYSLKSTPAGVSVTRL